MLMDYMAKGDLQSKQKKINVEVINPLTSFEVAQNVKFDIKNNQFDVCAMDYKIYVRLLKLGLRVNGVMV
jgi:hypothetical protein